MNLHSSMTHLIVRLDSGDRRTAPGCIVMAIDGAARAAAKADGFRSLGYDVTVVALDDGNEDARWKGKHTTPREFFAAEYDDGGVPRSWIVRNATR